MISTPVQSPTYQWFKKTTKKQNQNPPKQYSYQNESFLFCYNLLPYPVETDFFSGAVARAALTLKLIFILYSTPSCRTKASFFKASRSPDTKQNSKEHRHRYLIHHSHTVMLIMIIRRVQHQTNNTKCTDVAGYMIFVSNTLKTKHRALLIQPNITSSYVTTLPSSQWVMGCLCCVCCRIQQRAKQVELQEFRAGGFCCWQREILPTYKQLGKNTWYPYSVGNVFPRHVFSSLCLDETVNLNHSELKHTISSPILPKVIRFSHALLPSLVRCLVSIICQSTQQFRFSIVDFWPLGAERLAPLCALLCVHFAFCLNGP